MFEVGICTGQEMPILSTMPTVTPMPEPPTVTTGEASLAGDNTDGPFVKIGKRTVYPEDVSLVENYLSEIWRMNKYDTSNNVKK